MPREPFLLSDTETERMPRIIKSTSLQLNLRNGCILVFCICQPLPIAIFFFQDQRLQRQRVNAAFVSRSAMKCAALALILIFQVSGTRLQRKGQWLCQGKSCRCECGMSGMSLSQVEAKTPEDAVLLPPALPPPLPPMPPAALPPMPTFTWMTEDDLPKLGPPPPTTTMSTTLQPPPGLFSTGGDPAQMQADMMNGGFDHHYHYVPGINSGCDLKVDAVQLAT